MGALDSEITPRDHLLSGGYGYDMLSGPRDSYITQISPGNLQTRTKGDLQWGTRKRKTIKTRHRKVLLLSVDINTDLRLRILRRVTEYFGPTEILGVCV